MAKWLFRPWSINRWSMEGPVVLDIHSFFSATSKSEILVKHHQCFFIRHCSQYRVAYSNKEQWSITKFEYFFYLYHYLCVVRTKDWCIRKTGHFSCASAVATFILQIFLWHWFSKSISFNLNLDTLPLLAFVEIFKDSSSA